jgi:N-acetylneuraminic acid mutarotase
MEALFMRITQEQGYWLRTPAVLCALLFGGFCVLGTSVAQADTDYNWAWMKGSTAGNQPGVYGTIGSPALPNTPGARNRTTAWTDPSGGFWLFGGRSGNSNYFNDLWKYDRTTSFWAWMKGSQIANQAAVYGERLTPAAANTPGAREGAASWTDPSGALWLLGGAKDDNQYYNDFWKYDLSSGNWTWMKGSSSINQPTVYGTILTPSADAKPGSRELAATWTDVSGTLWLFGGYGYDSAGTRGHLNDLWKYDRSSGNWTWMKGSTERNQSGTYGTPETPALANCPGGREGAVTWIDSSGALWLFGGIGYDNVGALSELNDLWKYDPASGNWTWMNGSSETDHVSIYGTLGVPASDNVPGARWGASGWTDSSGAMWLFGGYGYGDAYNGYLNDMWKYDRSSKQWTWMKGSTTTYVKGSYGTPGTTSPNNTPGARLGAASWADSSGSLWLFGGMGMDGSAVDSNLNDLWRLTDTVAPKGTIVINDNQSVTNNAKVTLSLTWSDGPGSGVVRMKFSNDGTTWSTWEPLAATKTWTLPAGEGYKTVRVQYRDAAGNNSAVYSDYIRVDTIPPTGSIVINSGALSTTKRVVSLGLTWNDGTGSGVTRMRFSIDGAHWSAWEPQVTPKSYTLPATPGYYTVRVTYRDAGGNISATYSDYIKLVAAP